MTLGQIAWESWFYGHFLTQQCKMEQINSFLERSGTLAGEVPQSLVVEMDNDDAYDEL